MIVPWALVKMSWLSWVTFFWKGSAKVAPSPAAPVVSAFGTNTQYFSGKEPRVSEISRLIGGGTKKPKKKKKRAVGANKKP